MFNLVHSIKVPLFITWPNQHLAQYRYTPANLPSSFKARLAMMTPTRPAPAHWPFTFVAALSVKEAKADAPVAEADSEPEEEGPRAELLARGLCEETAVKLPLPLPDAVVDAAGPELREVPVAAPTPMEVGEKREETQGDWHEAQDAVSPLVPLT